MERIHTLHIWPMYEIYDPKCDIDLEDIYMGSMHTTSSYDGQHLDQVILKYNDKTKTMERTQALHI